MHSKRDSSFRPSERTRSERAPTPRGAPGSLAEIWLGNLRWRRLMGVGTFGVVLATAGVARAQVDGLAEDGPDLVAEIDAANANGPAADTIVLTTDINLSVAHHNDPSFDGRTGLPVVSSEVLIEGGGFEIRRDPVLPACPALPTPSPDTFRLITVAGGMLTLSNVVLRNGCTASAGGGAVLNAGGSVTLQDGAQVIDNGSSTDGGGIYNLGGVSGVATLTVEDSTFDGNHAYNRGGAISSDAQSGPASLSVVNSTFSNNNARYLAGLGGGAISNVFGLLTVERSTFLGNESDAGYGALFNGLGTANIGPGCVFAANLSGYAAIGNTGTMTMVDSVIGGTSPSDANVATSYGALYIAGDTTLTDVTVSHNAPAAPGNPGGIVIQGDTTLTRVSIVDNIGGGILWRSQARLTVEDSLVARNDSFGLSLAPNASSPEVYQMEVVNSDFVNNAGPGIAMAGVESGTDFEVDLIQSAFSNNAGPGFSLVGYDTGSLPSVGDLYVEDGSFDNNADAGMAIFLGGSPSQLMVRRSAFTGNGRTGLLTAMGMGAVSTLESSTIAGNGASPPPSPTDAGVFLGWGDHRVLNCTIVGQVAGSGLEGLASASTIEVYHSIVADNPTNCANVLVSANNLTDASDASCPAGFERRGDIDWEPLADNGGPTLSIAVGSMSAALDRHDNAASSTDVDCAPLDQRGVVRPGDAGDPCDRGAVESSAGNFVAPSVGFALSESVASLPSLGHDVEVAIDVPAGITLGVDVSASISVVATSATAGTDFGNLGGSQIDFVAPLSPQTQTVTIPLLDYVLQAAEETIVLELRVVRGGATEGPIIQHIVFLRCGNDNARCGAGNVCIASQCVAPSGLSDPCDSGDDADCLVGHLCDTDTTCRLDAGQSGCGNDDSTCAGTQVCVADTCTSAGSTGDLCDLNETADCAANHFCVGNTCRLVAGQACTEDDDCAEVCISLSCAAPSTLGGPCDPGQAGDCATTGAQCPATSSTCVCGSDASCGLDKVCDQTGSLPTCEPAGLCGNGVVESGEACDDGGVVDGDACSALCLFELGQPCTTSEQCAGSGECDTTSGLCVCGADGDCAAGEYCDLTISPAACAVDVDECSNGTNSCDPLVTCTNTNGGFECGACPAGYDDMAGDGTSCTAVGDCAEGPQGGSCTQGLAPRSGGCATMRGPVSAWWLSLIVMFFVSVRRRDRAYVAQRR